MYQNSYRRRPSPVATVRHGKGALITSLVLVAAVIVGVGFIIVRKPIVHIDRTAQSPGTTKPSFNKRQYALDDPASPWVVANKQRPLNPKQYAPTDLTTPNIPLGLGKTDATMQVRAEAAGALEALVAAADKDGAHLMLLSGYRSYQTQVSTYNSEVTAYGQATADRESARPGHSEHQTGWAADLGAASRKCRIQACFGELVEGKWLAANAYKYGFVLRYTADKEAITGYTYEPWHVRYVGTTLSNELHNTNTKTLEEFFDLPAAPNY